MLDKNSFVIGKITWNSLEQFFKFIVDNPDKNDWAYETLLEVDFEGNLVLDVEWNDRCKMFIIRVVASHNWDYPEEKRLCDDLTSLKENVAECVNNIKIILEGDMTKGLDAYVHCNCYEEGKTTEPPVDRALIYQYNDTWLGVRYPKGMSQEESRALDDKMYEWEKNCCQHPYRRICDVRVGNLSGIEKFCDAVVKAGGYPNKYPTLTSIIPRNNDGFVEASQFSQVLTELEDFCNHLEQQVGVFVVDVKTGNTIFSCVQPTLISWSKAEKINVGFDREGLFVVETDDKATFDYFLDMKGSNGIANVIAIEKFRSKHFTRKLLTDRDWVLLTDVATNKQCRVKFPPLFPKIEVLEFKVITRSFKSSDFLAIEALRKLLNASINTGNPIHWADLEEFDG